MQTIEAVIQGNLDHFERVNGRLVCNTAVARDSRKQVAELKRDVKEVEVRIKSTEKEVATVDKLQLEIQEATCKVKGPFKERFDAVIDELRLKRAAYHSGAFVGSDINKVFKLKNIPKFGHIFKPLTILGVSFSSCTLRVKITCLLNKFRLCYNLYTANRPLCKHEVELLVLRCCSFGSWFPVNFPNESLKRKFHLLTVEVPRQARRLCSVG